MSFLPNLKKHYRPDVLFPIVSFFLFALSVPSFVSELVTKKRIHPDNPYLISVVALLAIISTLYFAKVLNDCLEMKDRLPTRPFSLNGNQLIALEAFQAMSLLFLKLLIKTELSVFDLLMVVSGLVLIQTTYRLLFCEAECRIFFFFNRGCKIKHILPQLFRSIILPNIITFLVVNGQKIVYIVVLFVVLLVLLSMKFEEEFVGMTPDCRLHVETSVLQLSLLSIFSFFACALSVLSVVSEFVLKEEKDSLNPNLIAIAASFVMMLTVFYSAMLIKCLSMKDQIQNRCFSLNDYTLTVLESSQMIAIGFIKLFKTEISFSHLVMIVSGLMLIRTFYRLIFCEAEHGIKYYLQLLRSTVLPNVSIFFICKGQKYAYVTVSLCILLIIMWKKLGNSLEANSLEDGITVTAVSETQTSPLYGQRLSVPISSTTRVRGTQMSLVYTGCPGDIENGGQQLSVAMSSATEVPEAQISLVTMGLGDIKDGSHHNQAPMMEGEGCFETAEPIMEGEGGF